MAPERTPAPIHPGPESTFVDLLLLGMMPAVMLFGYKGMDALSSWLSGAGVPKSALPHVRYRRRRIAAAAGVVLCLCLLIGSVSFQAEPCQGYLRPVPIDGKVARGGSDQRPLARVVTRSCGKVIVNEVPQRRMLPYPCYSACLE